MNQSARAITILALSLLLPNLLPLANGFPNREILSQQVTFNGQKLDYGTNNNNSELAPLPAESSFPTSLPIGRGTRETTRSAKRHIVWDTSNGLHRPQSQQSGGSGPAWAQGPRFQLEPAAFVEYSNSTGAVIPCRPASSAVPLAGPALAHPLDGPELGRQNSKPPLPLHASNLPISISWHQVKALGSDSEFNQESKFPVEGPKIASGGSGSRFVRQDGSLIISPFKANEFDKDLHSSTYRCCLANRFGSLCSRPVRTRAVVDNGLNPEVYDEFALVGNSAILRCQIPSFAWRHVEFVGWLRDDKLIPVKFDPRSRWENLTSRKYLLTQLGELYIRNLTKFDQANYKCRIRNKLTNSIVTSKIGAQLIIDDSKIRTSLRLLNNQQETIVLAHEQADDFGPAAGPTNSEPEAAILCAYFQSQPVARFAWFKRATLRASTSTNDEFNDQLVPVNQENFPEARQIDSCLIIQQVSKLKHEGDYICEANNGAEPVLRATLRLVVNSAQLNVQLQLTVDQAQYQQQQLTRFGSVESFAQTTNSAKLHIVPFNSSPILNCSIAGFPYDTVAWFKDSRPLHLETEATSSNGSGQNQAVEWPESNIKLVQPHVIQIENFAPKDRGVYQCQVYSRPRSPGSAHSLSSNSRGLYASGSQQEQQKFSSQQHGLGFVDSLLERDHFRSASSSLQLDVRYSRPSLNVKFSNQSLEQDSTLSIQCSASGLPLPRIIWFLDNQPILGNANSNAGELDEEQEEHPLIDYSYLDSTMFNHDEQQAQAILEQPQQQLSWLPSSIQAPGSLVYELATSDRANVLRSNRQLNQAIIDERFQISNSRVSAGISQQAQPTIMSQLNVTRMTISETGQYKCLALNSLGATQHSAQISVLGSPAASEPANLKLRTYQAPNVTLVAGRQAILQCPLIGYPLDRIDWFKDNQRLPANHRQRIEPIKRGFGGQLELSNVDPKTDAGIYMCRATTSGQQQGADVDQLANSKAPQKLARPDYEGLVGQIGVQIKTAPLIDLQSLPEVVQANEGMRTKLVCSVVQGDHPIEIKWLKRIGGFNSNGSALSGRSLLSSGAGNQSPLAGYELMQNLIGDEGGGKDESLITIHNLEDSSLLTFKQISYPDSADYLCLAQNEIGSSMRMARVIVNVAPSWSLEPPAEINVLLGARLHIDCMAHGFPRPGVAWKRASLAGGQGEAEGERAQQNKQRANINSNNQVEFVNLISNFRQRAYLNGSLIIDQVDQNDDGQIMCEVANGIGIGLSKVTRVHVNVPPNFKQPILTYLGQLNSRAELKCSANGDQPMLIAWRREGELANDLTSNSTRHRILDSSRKLRAKSPLLESKLQIDNLTRSDSGHYVCMASNEFGSEDLRIQLIVQEAPEAPVLMRPIKTSSRQATISFRPPYSGNSQIKKYIIYYKQLDSIEAPFAYQGVPAMSANSSKESFNWQQMIVDAPSLSSDQLISMQNNGSNSASFPNDPQQQQQPPQIISTTSQLVNLNLCCLQPFTKYLVQVSAANEIGPSEASRPIQFLTDEEAIGGPPLDVSVEPTGAHSLKVVWRAPMRNLRNGFVRGYYIGYRAIASSQPSALSPLNPVGSSTSPPALMNQQNFNVRVLESDNNVEQYQYKNIQLEASNFQQQLLMSSLKASTNQSGSISSQPDEFPLKSSSNLSSSGGIAGSLNSDNGAGQMFTSYLTNLKRKTSYSIIVQAYNKVGAGPRSDQIIVSTLDAAPPMSPVLKVVAVTHNSATLVWASRRFVHQQESSLNNSSLSVMHSLNNHQQQLKYQNNNLNLNLNLKQGLFKGFDDGFGPLISTLEDEEDDDPLSYYTVNYRVEESRPSQVQLGANNLPMNRNHGPAAVVDEQWQQRRLQRRGGQQQIQPYVLNNLRCGSNHLVFMTATNSLGQSEPGSTVKFTTSGGAPIAPATARDFIQLNATYAVLRLGNWQNAGCLINSFTLKYKSIDQVKWVILEHQVYPIIQTVTISGLATFSTKPLPVEAAVAGDAAFTNHGEFAGDLEERQQQQQQAQTRAGNAIGSSKENPLLRQHAQSGLNFVDSRQQTINDFVLRNLLPMSLYKLVVEANSEAGSTTAEYELDTGNLTSSLVSVNVVGVNSQENGLNELLLNRKAQMGFDSETNGGSDFSFSGGQRRSPGASLHRYNLNLWSMSVLFLAALLVTLIATLVLAFKSVMRLKPLSRETSLLSSMFCCSSPSSAASASGSSHSSSAGTCYQTTGDHQLDGYGTCPALVGANHGILMSSDSSVLTRRQASTISGRLDRCDLGGSNELKSAIGSNLNMCNSIPLNSRQQLVTSSSLSTINPRLMLGQRFTNTLGRGHLLNGASGRRLSGGSGEDELNLEQSAEKQIRAHYAATLGKQHTVTTPLQQPFKLANNANCPLLSPLYGKLRPVKMQNYLQQQEEQLNENSANYNYPHPQFHSSSICMGTGTGTATSGYETSNSIARSSESDCHQVYLQNLSNDAYQPAQINVYGLTNGLAENNLFDSSANNDDNNHYQMQQQQQIYHEQGAMSELNRGQVSQIQGQFQYSIPMANNNNNSGDSLNKTTIAGGLSQCQQTIQAAAAAEQLANTAYGMIFGNQTGKFGGDQPPESNFDQQQQDFNQQLRLLTNTHNNPIVNDQHSKH